MRQAGASEEEFPTTVGHWTYAKRAIHAADSGNGLFLGRPIASYAPRPGDLVHMNRNGGTVTYEQARNTTGYRAESGIVVETDHATGTAVLVVGNQEPDGNIGRENVRVSENGLIVQRPHDPFICAIEVLK